MKLKQLVRKNRTRRRFFETARVSRRMLRGLVDMARLAPSGANRQPLKYMLSNTARNNGLIFPCLSWAGYLKGWPGPVDGERPAAYVVVLGDTGICESFDCDAGIAVQTIMLGAVESGLGGCIVGSVDRKRLRKSLNIPERYAIVLVLALGRPIEQVVIEEAGGDDIKYWRDSRKVHHVPKRRLKEIILS